MKKEKVIHTFVVLAYKESQYLENCIKSVINQKYKSEVVIATSTPNKFIESLAKKYNFMEHNCSFHLLPSKLLQGL